MYYRTWWSDLDVDGWRKNILYLRSYLQSLSKRGVNHSKKSVRNFLIFLITDIISFDFSEKVYVIFSIDLPLLPKCLYLRGTINRTRKLIVFALMTHLHPKKEIEWNYNEAHHGKGFFTQYYQGANDPVVCGYKAFDQGHNRCPNCLFDYNEGGQWMECPICKQWYCCDQCFAE